MTVTEGKSSITDTLTKLRDTGVVIDKINVSWVNDAKPNEPPKMRPVVSLDARL